VAKDGLASLRNSVSFWPREMLYGRSQIPPHAPLVHAFAKYSLTAGEMNPALGMLLMLVYCNCSKGERRR
jgi:hypothetical protein